MTTNRERQAVRRFYATWSSGPVMSHHDCYGSVVLAINYDALLSQVERLQKRVAELEALTSWTHTDDVAVNRFCVAMIEKLAKKREQGYSGWDDPQECTLGMLAKMLIDHISKGDPVDIANFCMMVWTRGETDEDHAPAVQAIQTAALVAAITAKAIP